MFTFFKKFSVDLWILVAIGLYFFAAKAGLLLTFKVSGEAVLWPPPGLALALLLLLGKRIWPGIALGSVLAGLLWFLHMGVVLSASVIYSSLFMAVGQTLEALLGFYLIKRALPDISAFGKSSHVFRFLFIVLGVCLVGAGSSTITMLSADMINIDNVSSFFVYKWLENEVSILVITPFIISWKDKFKISFVRPLIFEGLFVSVYLVALIMLFQTLPIQDTISRAMPILIIPIFVWIIFRLNIQTLMSAIMIASFMAIYVTTQGIGPFHMESESNSLLLVQIFIGMASILSLVLYSTVKERKDIQVALEGFNEKLEKKVDERTHELAGEVEVRKEMEEKTKVSNRRLRKTNAELDHFVYSVSHDLRAPIATILGLVNLGKHEGEIKSLNEILIKIEESANRQDKYINDIVDFSRNSRLAVKKDKVMFEDLINETINDLEYEFKGKKMKKNIDIKQDSAFISDRARLKVVFHNVLNNAMRYTNGKNPVIDIKVVSDDGEADIIVKDNGIGIDDEHLSKVFKMFYRATEEGTGSGLGLYIVKETLDKLNGKINIESGPGQGTIVKVKLPRVP